MNTHVVLALKPISALAVIVWAILIATYLPRALHTWSLVLLLTLPNTIALQINSRCLEKQITQISALIANSCSEQSLCSADGTNMGQHAVVYR